MQHTTPTDQATRPDPTPPAAASEHAGARDGPATDVADAETTLINRPLAQPSHWYGAAPAGGTSMSQSPAGNSMTQLDVPPPPPYSWQLPAAGRPYAEPRRERGALPPGPPMVAASSWGPTSLAFDANTAAGMSYLLGWISGLLVYFNERENRYVRFHALQSILFSAAAIAFGVLASIACALCFDLGRVTHWQTFDWIGRGIAVLSVFSVVLTWSAWMLAAWTGIRWKMPFVGRYAERYAAPPIQQQSAQ